MYRRIAIFGAGASGVAARNLAVGLGVEVCVFDEGGQGDAAEFGEALLSEFDAFVFSPGFAADHPWRVVVEHSSLPCYGELGFAAMHWRGRLIGVTGTNGKTTITSFLREALNANGIKAVEAGNIGIPLSDYILSEVNHSKAYAVCEISSFQAELPAGLQLDGLIWSNFAEDHLDRYASMQDYFMAKKKLLGCLRPRAVACLGADVEAFDSSVLAVPNAFSVSDKAEWINSLPDNSFFCSPPQSANFALVVVLWRALELPVKPLLRSASTFQPVPHRLSKIDEWSGVAFWNDSKATNFHAALAAIDAMEVPVYWIGGGSYKGGDLEAFARAVALRVKRVLLYGAVAERLAECFNKTSIYPVVSVHFAEAVQAATFAALQDPPAAVLMSPGFASFDQFSGYAARGEMFISTILNLKDRYCSD